MKISIGSSWAFETLSNMPKDTVLYTILQKVSRSGMLRRIKLVAVVEMDGKPEIISIALPESQFYDHKKGNYKVPGCGMDMGFHLVHSIGELIKGNGYWFKQRWL